MASSQVIRVTLFKVPKTEHIDAIVENYKELAKTQSKDGKPYILSLEAGPSYDDARNQGYTMIAKTAFKNMEDFEYYDKECQAHKDFKVKMAAFEIHGVMMVYYTPDAVAYA